MMHPEDTSIRKRHTTVSRSRTFENLRTAFKLGKLRVLDIGCGYGEYLAEFGLHSVGITTRPDEAAYGDRTGLDIRIANAEALAEARLDPPFDAVWANNLFEHLLAPHAFLMELTSVVRTEGMLILGVPVVPIPALLMRLRRFRGALATSHIGFYTRHTLRLTVERAGWEVIAVRPFILRNAFLDSLLAPLAPHLYVIARYDPAFVYDGKKVHEWENDPRYARLLTLGGSRRPV